MQRRYVLRVLAAGATLALGCGLGACTSSVYYPRSRWYRYPYAYYDYYYYPDSNVYFHIYSGYYYYPYGGRWRRSRTLPRHFQLNPALRRRLQIHDRYPYARNHYHRDGWERSREWGRHEHRERHEERERQWERLEPRPQERTSEAPRRPESRREPPREAGPDLSTRDRADRPAGRREPQERAPDLSERRRIEAESRERRREGEWPPPTERLD